MANRQVPPAQTTIPIVTNDTSSNLKHVELLPNVTIEEESHVTIAEELLNVTIEEESHVTIEEESLNVTIESPNVAIEESPSVTIEGESLNVPIESPNVTTEESLNVPIESPSVTFEESPPDVTVKKSKERAPEAKDNSPNTLLPWGNYTNAEICTYREEMEMAYTGYTYALLPESPTDEAAPSLDGSEPSTHKPSTPAPRLSKPQTPRMSRLEKEAAKSARHIPKTVFISPTPLPKIVEADQATTAGIPPVPDPLEPTIFPQVAEAGDARGAAMPAVTPEPTLSPLEAVPPMQVPLAGAQITAANTFRNRLRSTARLSRYRKDLEKNFRFRKP